MSDNIGNVQSTRAQIKDPEKVTTKMYGGNTDIPSHFFRIFNLRPSKQKILSYRVIAGDCRQDRGSPTIYIATTITNKKPSFLSLRSSALGKSRGRCTPQAMILSL